MCGVSLFFDFPVWLCSRVDSEHIKCFAFLEFHRINVAVDFHSCKSQNVFITQSSRIAKKAWCNNHNYAVAQTISGLVFRAATTKNREHRLISLKQKFQSLFNFIQYPYIKVLTMASVKLKIMNTPVYNFFCLSPFFRQSLTILLKYSNEFYVSYWHAAPIMPNLFSQYNECVK